MLMKGNLKKAVIFTLLALLAFFVYGYSETYRLEVKQTVFKNNDIPEKFLQKRIVFASDFHCGIFFDASRVASTVEAINALDPDIVILGGDYIDTDKKYITPCFDELKKIRSKMGVYAILGNHDYRVGERLIKNAAANSSITILDNDARLLEIGGQRIEIGGVADFLSSTADLRPIENNVKPNDFVVLAAHNPAYAKKITSDKIDLVLSGHTHGGQINFFNLWIPFFDWKYGHGYGIGTFKTDKATVIVSNGVGTTILPIRIFARPEINEIILSR